jgi:hypothetical protein
MFWKLALFLPSGKQRRKFPMDVMDRASFQNVKFGKMTMNSVKKIIIMFKPKHCYNKTPIAITK